jgi:cytochrome c oxidase cbb3-type subunit 2
MIRPFRAETLRYGHYSTAGEFVYDHPFQWGSKRTGPDLARVGGRYSDEWHVQHLKDPRSVVPESVMPKYGWMLNNVIDGQYIADTMNANRIVGVPYTDAMMENAKADFVAQADPNADTAGLKPGDDPYTRKTITFKNELDRQTKSDLVRMAGFPRFRPRGTTGVL